MNISNITVSYMDFSGYNNEYIGNFITFNGFVSLISGVLGIILIQFKSPHIFSYYKNFLLNIAFWNLLLDIYISFFLKPKLFFPSLFFCPTGWLETTDYYMAEIWINFLWIFLGGENIALISAVVYSNGLLKGNLIEVLSYKLLFLLFIIFSTRALPIIVFYYLSSLDDVAIRKTAFTVSERFKT